MKLAKALKVKNRLAGEIALAVRLIGEANVVEGDNPPPHNVGELYEKMCENKAKLASLKARISIANGPIAEKIFAMAEMKAQIAWLRSLNTKDGTFTQEGRYGTNSTKVTYKATYSASWVEAEIGTISRDVERLQDEVDEFNATTEVL